MSGVTGEQRLDASDVSVTTATRSIVCTLAEGSYHVGVAALVNSLYAGGFRGDVWVGWRGERPYYRTLDGLVNECETSDMIEVASGVTIRLVFVETDRHLANYKAAFIARLFDCTDASKIFYFDPDIISLASWRFYDEWANCGVAVCEDCTYARFPATHPFRHSWSHVFANERNADLVKLDSYYNSGFVGVSRDTKAFIDCWEAALIASERLGADLGRLKSGGRQRVLQVPDQDTFNIAAMYSGQPISAIGPDAMGFIPGSFVMLHAIDAPKPWAEHYVRRYLRTGDRASMAHRAFWQNVNGPLQPISNWQRIRAIISIRVVIALGRFYRR